MEQTVNRKIMLIILAAGVFGILNTEMGFIGILPYIAEHYQVSIVQAGACLPSGLRQQGLPCPFSCRVSTAGM